MTMMADSRRKPPPPLPRPKQAAKAPATSTLEVEPLQIVSEEPSLDDLAERAVTREPPRHTQEVDQMQIVSEEPAEAVYELAVAEIPWNLLDHHEGALMSIIDGRRDVSAIVSISGLERDEVLETLHALAMRELIIRCG
jgi:hypothetical protein